MYHPSELREWHDEAQLTPPDHENNSDEGVDAADIDNEGHAWAKYPLWAIRDNKALPEAHRIACVFTHKVAHTLGYKDMAELVALNAESDGRCNSNDYCDANALMVEAFETVMGREWRMPSDVDEGKHTQEESDSGTPI